MRAGVGAGTPQLATGERPDPHVLRRIHHRLGWLGRPHSPQLPGFGIRSVEFGEYRDGIGVSLSHPAENHILPCELCQGGPPCGRRAAAGQRQVQSTCVQECV